MKGKPTEAIEFLRGTHIIWKDVAEKNLIEKAVLKAFSEGVEEMKLLIREFVMRSHYAFPETVEDTTWYEQGLTADFLLKIAKLLGLGNMEEPDAIKELLKGLKIDTNNK